MATMIRPVARRAIRERGLDPTSPVRHFDYLLVSAVVAIAALGLVMIYSTTHHKVVGDELYYVKRQALFLLLGGAAMAVTIAVDYRRLREFTMVIYGVTMLALVAVLSPLGSNVKGHQAWFQLPGGFTLQPSELAKFGIIVAVAGYCTQYRGELDAWRLSTTAVLAAVPIGLVLLQPDLGTVMVFVVMILGLLTMAGLTGRQLLVLGLLALTAVYAVTSIGLLKQYQVDRLTNFIEPASGNSQGSAYNTEQSKQAIAHGRITGEGLENGSQTQGEFVPEQHTDFIFTAVGEELGFVGSTLLLALFALVFWRIWRTARL